MNPVAVILRAVQLVRGWGVRVTFEPGWETRGNGYASRWVGQAMHHTGTLGVSDAKPFPTRAVLRDGRAGLSGPLCNSAGPWDGSVHVVAAQAANHAGAGGGKSMGPLPTTTLFNPLVFGHEIDYPGVTPMSPAQYKTAVLWGRALLIALVEAGQISRFDAERIRMHAETSITGKWDPGRAQGVTIDAAAFRRAVMVNPSPTIPTEEEDVTAAEVWQHNVAGKGVQAQDRLYGMDAIQLPAIRAAVGRVEAVVNAMSQMLAQIVHDPDVTPEQVKEIINAAIRDHMPRVPTEQQNAAALAPLIIGMVRESVEAAVAAGLQQDNAELADTIVNEMWDRLTPQESA